MIVSVLLYLKLIFSPIGDENVTTFVVTFEIIAKY